MSIQRCNTIVRGPAIVQFYYETRSTPTSQPTPHTYTFRTKGDVVFTPENQTFNVESSELGTIDRRASELMRTVRFTPVGVIDADGVDLLWPHLDKLPGQSLFPSDHDMTCTIIPIVAGTDTYDKIKLWNVTVSKMPDIFISAVQTQIGEVEIRGILDDNYDWGLESHVSFYADHIAPSLENLNPANIPTVPGIVSWGSYMTDIKTAEGVRFSFDMDTQDEVEDESGIYDITLTGLKATARLVPVAGFDMSLLADILHENDDQLRGSSIYRDDLVVTSRDPGGLAVTLYNAALLSVPMSYGATSRRFGELAF